jgi:hypothetical protein
MAHSLRKNERVPFAKPVRIRKPAPMDGKGVDIAVGGIGVEVPQPIAEGVTVELELFGGATVVAGIVRIVLASAGGHRLGIQFSKEDPSLVAKAQA